MRGLSPRVRGNPLSSTAPSLPMSVYPRECGGTSVEIDVPYITSGLSPRVRGNLPIAVHVQVGHGSIPASAGEPGQPSPAKAPARVYPRECGATVVLAVFRVPTRGLSRRVRGNRRDWQRGNVPSRSNPVSAGRA